MKLSIVTTLYRSRPFIGEFHRRATAAAQALTGGDYEIVMVNDGCPDGSREAAIALSQADPHVVVVDLSRNFGHHKAMMTGLAHALGDRIFLIDCDLEEDPEWLSRFDVEMARSGSDVVYGVQARRKGGLFERFSGYVFYRVFRLLSGMALPENVVVVRLMTRRYVNALLQHGEREVFMAGLWFLTGFQQSPLAVAKGSRSGTTYNLARRISLFVNSITSFSNKPLVGIFVLGCFISAMALLFTSFLVLRWFLYLRPPAGWTSVMASVWLLGGFLIASVGVIGIYIAKVFSETKQRPYTIVREIHGRSNAGRGP